MKLPSSILLEAVSAVKKGTSIIDLAVLQYCKFDFEMEKLFPMFRNFIETVIRH